MSTREMDAQAMRLANAYIQAIAEDVDESVKIMSKKMGGEPTIENEIAFRNTIGTMHMRAHIFAAVKILQSSGLEDKKIMTYIADMIILINKTDVVHPSENEQVH